MGGAGFERLQKELGELQKWAVSMSAESLAQVAESIGREFAVQTDEVAILELTPDRKFLQFLIPEKLRAIGQIPLTSATSLASRTARERKAELINHFNTVPHASVFEGVPLRSENNQPIQKIMSAPLLLDGKAVGVIQISRKGKTGAAAGPDFTPLELRELVAVAEMTAPLIVMPKEQ
ncbi:MAG: GAF domain-containing protein [Candidatus Acidiferrales bacterium]